MKNDDHLRSMMLEYYQKFKSLPINCETRWTSLRSMVQEFLNHWLGPNYAMEYLGESFAVSNDF